MKVSSCSTSVAPPKITMIAKLVHCRFDTLRPRASTQPICASVAAIATPVATKMFAALKATKKRIRGKKSKRSFTAGGGGEIMGNLARTDAGNRGKVHFKSWTRRDIQDHFGWSAPIGARNAR